MKAKNLILNAFVMALVCSTAMFVYHKAIKSQTAYVDIKKVFNNFEMKKELEAKYKVTQQKRDKILDSLEVNLRVISKHLNDQKASAKKLEESLIVQFEAKRREYLNVKKRFQEDNAALSRQYDSQILEQINQYITEYGKKNNYDFIYGADGSGTLMYSNDKYNLSEEICVFINNKYKGAQ